MAESQAIVHVVEDDDRVARSIAELLDSVELQAELHSSAEGFLAGYNAGRPGCAVVDVCLPGMTGLMLQDAIEKQGHQLPLIFLTGHADVSMAVETLTKGAFGFLEKPHRMGEFLELVRRAVNYDIHRRERETDRIEWKNRFSQLTPRENSVARLVVQGRTNKEIAQELKISPRTVELHRSRLMEKLSASNLAEVVQGWLLAKGDDPEPNRAISVHGPSRN